MLRTLLPPLCVLCGAETAGSDLSSLCNGCCRDLPGNSSCCKRCALPLATPGTSFCGHCLRAVPAFEHSIIPFLYTTPVDKLINQFKHQRDLCAGRLLAQLFFRYAQTDAMIDTKPEMLVPVPLHWQRQLTRSFNQSLFLANYYGLRFDIPVQSIRKIKKTPPQQNLNRKTRLRNLQHSFLIDTKRFEGIDHVAIVDDVMTTGATAEILSRQLREAGVQRIDVWCLARTPKH